MERKSNFFFKKPLKIPFGRNARWVLFAFVVLFYGKVFSLLITPTELPKAGERASLYFNEGPSLKDLYLSALGSAQQSIFLEIYCLSDYDLIQIIDQKLSSSKVTGLIRYDPTALKHSYLPKMATLEPVEISGLMHRKILVIDHHLTLMGSANLTRTSLTQHDNLVVGIDDTNFARELEQGTLNISSKIKNQNLLFFRLPEKKQEAFDHLIEMLKGAKKTIRVAMFTFTHPLLQRALFDAAKRGVDVSVILDYNSSIGASYSIAKQLYQHKIPLITGPSSKLIHHKWTLIDDEALVMGSANWTSAAFKQNWEYLLVLNDLSDEQKERIHKAWALMLQEGKPFKLKSEK